MHYSTSRTSGAKPRPRGDRAEAREQRAELIYRNAEARGRLYTQTAAYNVLPDGRHAITFVDATGQARIVYGKDFETALEAAKGAGS